MSFFDKMIETIGLGYEEYDDGNETVEEQHVAREKSQRKSFPIRVKEQDSIPPEFLQHLQEKEAPAEIGPFEETAPVRRPEIKEVKEKRSSFFGGRKDDDDASAVSALAKAMHVLIITPKTFDDSQTIADYVKNNQAVIVNCEKADYVVTSRIKDFVCGVVYALGGTVQKITETSMFCAPRSVDVKTNQFGIY